MAAGRPATASELAGALPEGLHLDPAPMGLRTPGPTLRLRGVEANTNPAKGSPVPPQTGTWCQDRDVVTSEFPAKDIRRERPLDTAGLTRDGGIY